MAKAALKAVVPATKPAVKAAPSKAVSVVTKKTQAVAVHSDAFEDMAGYGMENVTSKDLVIPRIAILQSLSPQLKKKDPQYIADAEEGNFCNVATNTLYTELLVIPCFYARVFLEWAPRETGKGLVQNHGTNSAILEQCEPDEKRRYFLPNGNQIIETMTYYCLNITTGQAEMCFIPLSSTQLKNARKWMTMLAAEKLTRADGSMFTPPMFFRAWKVTAAAESNNQGDWYGWRFEAADPIVELDPSMALLHEAKSCYEKARDGMLTADASPFPEEQAQGDM